MVVTAPHRVCPRVCAQQLMLYTALALLMGLRFFRQYDPEPGSGAPAPPPDDSAWNSWYLTIGVVCGCAVCIKW